MNFKFFFIVLRFGIVGKYNYYNDVKRLRVNCVDFLFLVLIFSFSKIFFLN